MYKIIFRINGMESSLAYPVYRTTDDGRQVLSFYNTKLYRETEARELCKTLNERFRGIVTFEVEVISDP